MARTKISEFSSTPASNTDIDSINIAEGCSPSGINDAIRELMSQLKDWQSGTSNDPYVVGSSGSLTLNQGTANGVAYLNGSKVVTSGSALVFDGTNLGVGTSSPASKLDVYGTGSQTVSVRSATSGDVKFYAECAGTNSGWMQYTRSLQALQWSANGSTQHLTLDSSGNLGLGVTPSAWSLGRAFEIAVAGAGFLGNGNQLTASKNAYYNAGWKYARTGDNALQYDMNGGTHAWYTAPSGTAGNAITFTQAMTLDASGNLGLGTTSPSARVHAVGSGVDAAEIQVQNTSTSSGCRGLVRVKSASSTYGGGLMMSNATDSAYPTSSLLLYNFDSAPLVFGTANTERARIDSSGNLLVGTTSGSARVTAQGTGTSDIYFAKDSSGVSQFSVTYNGSIYARDTTVRSISDARLKENIVDSDYGLNVITALRPVRYDWKEGYGNPDQLGFIAQEVEQIFPRMIGEWKIKENEDAYKTIGPGDLIPVLVKAIQEMKSIIDDQAARIAVLEAK